MVNTLVCFLIPARNAPYDLCSRLPRAATEVAYFNVITLLPVMAGFDCERAYLLRQIEALPHIVEQGRAVVISQVPDFQTGHIVDGVSTF